MLLLCYNIRFLFMVLDLTISAIICNMIVLRVLYLGIVSLCGL